MADKAAKQNVNIQKWVAALSVLLLIVKFISYYYTHSVAILTDALESIVNVVAGFVGLYSLSIAARPRDENHPYGHGKIEFLSAAIEGVMIGLAGVFILYKAIIQLLHPVALHELDLGMILIGITAVMNYIMGSICVRHGKKNQSLALEVSGRHLQTDTYSTIGVVVGLAVLYITKIQWVDAAVAIVLSVLIMYTSYTVMRRSVAGIMDEADAQLLKEMIGMINKNRRESWVDLHNLRVIKFGSILHVDCHFTVPWYFTVKQAHEEIDYLSRLVKSQYGESMELFIHTDACNYSQCPVCYKSNCPVRQHPFEKKLEWTLQNLVQNTKHTSASVNL